MNANRRRGKAVVLPGGKAVVVLPAAVPTADPRDTKLDAILDELANLRRLVHRIAVPLETIRLTEAARRLSRSTKWVKTLLARGVFSDGRPPENRGAGADLVFFADEIEVFHTEGEEGVKRLRKELGR